MSVRPLHDRVLVKRVEEETKTAGGIIIPDNNKEKPMQGEIMAVGSGYRMQDGGLRALDVKAGDKVLFGKYAGTEVKVDGNEYIIMKASLSQHLHRYHSGSDDNPMLMTCFCSRCSHFGTQMVTSRHVCNR